MDERRRPVLSREESLQIEIRLLVEMSQRYGKVLENSRRKRVEGRRVAERRARKAAGCEPR